MFAKSFIVSSLLALAAIGKPIARREVPSASNVAARSLGGVFDPSSSSVLNIQNGGSFVFNDFGGLSSLHGFDDFFGAGNFLGLNNAVVVQQNVVTCQVTQVNIVQQQLAILAEYAKQVILTQSCDSEAQVLIFSQWLGGLVNFGQNLRHINGVVPTFDSHIASQIVNVVDVSGNINLGGFDFSGASIGSNSVTVLSNWVQNISPSTVGFVWESAVLAAGSIPLGVSCNSQICTAPAINRVSFPVFQTINTGIKSGVATVIVQ